MEGIPLDEIDRGILHLLQQDARNYTPVEMARQIPVSDGTVRNRIDALENEDIIEGYVPTLNYEAAGFPLKIVFSCTARIPERADLAQQALQIEGVIRISELMTGRENVRITAVATHTDDITQIAHRLDALGFEVESEELMRHEYVQPFNHFGQDAVEGE